jgi:hypothetical protein
VRGSWVRGARGAVLLGTVAVAVLGGAACILADPPADLPVSPILPPEIVGTAAQPPVTDFLDTIPNQLAVPVNVDQREATLVSQLFVDGIQVSETVDQTISASPMLVTIGSVSAASQECHTLELLVSYGDGKGSDRIDWFYSPTLSFIGCPVYDAGPGDAGQDGGDDGGGGD